MNRKLIYSFAVLLVITVVSIEGQSTTPHFCEALETNNNRIDYTLNFPKKTYFNNYIVIKGFFWAIQLSPTRRKRQDFGSENPTDEPEANGESVPPIDPSQTTAASSGAEGAGSGPISLKALYGTKFPETTFFDDPYKCAFSGKYESQENPEQWDRNLVGGITEDYTKVKWVVVPVLQDADTDQNSGQLNDTQTPESDSGNTNEGQNGADSDLNSGSDNNNENGDNSENQSNDFNDNYSDGGSDDRKKRQFDDMGDNPMTNNPDLEDLTDENGQPIGNTPSVSGDQSGDGTDTDSNKVKEFATDFKGYAPQVAFSTIRNIEIPKFVFIETIPYHNQRSQSRGSSGPTTDPYFSRLRGYLIKEAYKNEGWENITAGAQAVRFRKRRQDSGRAAVPLSIWNSVNKLYIKGIFPVQMPDSNPGTVLLIETCPEGQPAPCASGTTIYKYCMVGDDEANPTAEGQPCHPSKLHVLFDCTIPWKTTPPPVPPGGGDGENGSGDGGASPQPGPGPDGSPNDADPNASPSPSEKAKSEKSMAWLWILIVVIIIIIIIAIIICLFCCKGKGKKSEAAPTPSGSQASGIQASPSSTRSKDLSGGAKGAKGMPRTPSQESTMSTASTRSKLGSSGV